MSQVQTIRDMDAFIIEDLLRAGMADEATYTAPTPGATPVPCHALVDRAVQFYDEREGVAGHRTTVVLFQAQVAAPGRMGVITITASGETFTLDQLDARDESMSRWVVAHG